MKKTRYTESQIVGILKELEQGMSVAELSRKHGVSDGAIYQWRTKYNGMTESDLRRLKHMYAELSLDHRV